MSEAVDDGAVECNAHAGGVGAFRPRAPGASGKRPLRDSATLSFLARRCRPLPPPLVPGAVGRARTRSTPGPLEGETTMNSVAPMGRLNPDRGSHPVLDGRPANPPERSLL